MKEPSNQPFTSLNIWKPKLLSILIDEKQALTYKWMFSRTLHKPLKMDVYNGSPLCFSIKLILAG